MMETYKIRGITYQEEQVSKKVIRQGIRNILDHEGDEGYGGRKIVKKIRRVYEEEEDEPRRRRPRGAVGAESA